MRRAGTGTAALLAALLIGLLAPALVGPASAQDLGGLSKQVRGQQAAPDTLPPGPPPAPWTMVAGEVALGAGLAAVGGYAVGLLAETVCDGCDASEPGGDTPGILIGLPLGAVAGVWLASRGDPHPGRLEDTAVAALAGAAVFGGYTRILEGQGKGVRWAAVIFPGALAAMGWNRSRTPDEPPAVSLRTDPPTRWGSGELHAELRVVRLRF